MPFKASVYIYGGILMGLRHEFKKEYFAWAVAVIYTDGNLLVNK